MSTQLFIGTVGVKYAFYKHPTHPRLTAAHYITVEAENLGRAHQLMNHEFGEHWAFLYPEKEYPLEKVREDCPAGCYMHITDPHQQEGALAA